MKIKTVSFSRLKDFEVCKYRALLKYAQHIPEPPRPLPQGATEHANDRGTRVHEGAELYVRGKIDLITELKDFTERFSVLRSEFEAGNVRLEEEWAVNREWEPVAWASEDAWCRMKLDAVVINDTSARVIDYKTGRRIGNEVKHTEQGQIYQLATFLRFPELTDIAVEFWYTDQDHVDTKVYTRAQGVQYFDKYNRRFLEVTECEDFPPRANVFSCKWCAYNGNACEYGVQAGPQNGKNKSGRR